MNRIGVWLYPDMAAMRSIGASENKDVREYCLQHAVRLLHKGLLNFSNQEFDLFILFYFSKGGAKGPLDESSDSM